MEFMSLEIILYKLTMCLTIRTIFYLEHHLEQFSYAVFIIIYPIFCPKSHLNVNYS